jgi:hypothetical protein
MNMTDRKTVYDYCHKQWIEFAIETPKDASSIAIGEQ